MTQVQRQGQEYWIVTPMKCQCGNSFTRRPASVQRLYEQQSVHVEMLRARCESCGRDADLEFDSPCFGKGDATSFAGDQRTLRDVFGFAELGIEGALKYFSELSALGDIDALDFLMDAASHFLENAREISRTDPN